MIKQIPKILNGNLGPVPSFLNMNFAIFPIKIFIKTPKINSNTYKIVFKFILNPSYAFSVFTFIFNNA